MLCGSYICLGIVFIMLPIWSNLLIEENNSVLGYEDRLKRIQRNLDLAKKTPYGDGMAASELDEVLTGIDTFDYRGNTAKITTVENLWRRDSLREYFDKRRRQLGWNTDYLFERPILGSNAFCFVGDGQVPDYFLIQHRGSGTSQGDGQIMAWGTGGFVAYPEHPAQTVLREVKEEIGVEGIIIEKNHNGELVELESRLPRKVADMFVHYFGSERTFNPSAVYLMRVDRDECISKFPIIESYSDVTGEISEGEVTGAYLVAPENMVPIFEEARKVGGDFSDSLRSAKNLPRIFGTDKF